MEKDQAEKEKKEEEEKKEKSSIRILAAEDDDTNISLLTITFKENHSVVKVDLILFLS